VTRETCYQAVQRFPQPLQIPSRRQARFASLDPFYPLWVKRREEEKSVRVKVVKWKEGGGGGERKKDKREVDIEG
jgi:hypothetical protein